LQSGIVVDSAAGGGRWRRTRPRPLCRRRCGRSTRGAGAGTHASAGIAASSSAARAAAGLGAAAGIAAGCRFSSALDGTGLNRCDGRCGRNGNWGRYGLDRWRGGGRAACRRGDIPSPVGCHGGRNSRVGGLQVLRLQGSWASGEACRFGSSGSALGGGAGFLCCGRGGGCRRGRRKAGLADAGAGCCPWTRPGRDPGCRCTADLRSGGADCCFRWPDCRVAGRDGSRRRCRGSGGSWVGRRARWRNRCVTGQGRRGLRGCLCFPQRLPAGFEAHFRLFVCYVARGLAGLFQPLGGQTVLQG